ncbi:MAG: hypothetical protein ACOYBE_07815 [Blautia sp.]
MAGKHTGKKLHERNGAAMVVVLCIMAVLLVLSLTILLSGASLVGSAKKNRAAVNCRIMAESFQDLLDKEITGKTIEVDGFPRVNSDVTTSQPIAYFAMRSLREQVEKGVSADENKLIKVQGSDEDAEEFRIYYGDGQPYNESDYQMKMKVYLQADHSVLLRNLASIWLVYGPDAPVVGTGNKFSGKFIDHYRALIYRDGGIDSVPDSDAEVRLHTEVTCSKGNEQFVVKSVYKVTMTCDPTGVFVPILDEDGNVEKDEEGNSKYKENAPEITWKWEKV